MTSAPVIELETCVLGGGFAGVSCARTLARAVRRGKISRVGLVAAENHMVFQPMLPEVAAGSLSPRHVVNPIRQLCRSIQIFKGEVYRIDPEERVLHLQAGDFTPRVQIKFNRLVVALGARINISRVPGMAEHAYLIQNVGDAMRIRATVISRFEEANLVASPELQKHLLTFVIIGGGYSGVETAGGLIDMVQAILPFYENISPQRCRVFLVHSQEYLLPTLGPKLGRYTHRILADKGMHILLSERVSSITAQSVTLSSGSVIHATTVISTVGNSPHPLVTDLADTLGLETDRGRLPTDSTGQIPGFDWLWGCGDCAATPLPDGSSSPPTAQFAQRQGIHVGRNICALENGKPTKPFRFKGMGELAAIGHQRAVGNIFGLRLAGFFAWWLWRTVYLAKLPGIQRKLRVAADWTFDLFFKRDINLLNPRYTKVLKEFFLEPDTVLFNPGDPAFSLYFVKSGEINISDGDRIVKTVRQGEYFGERALMEDRLWRFRAVAATETRLVALGASEFETILNSSNAMHQLFSRSSKAYMDASEVEQLKAGIPAERLLLPVSSVMNKQIQTIPHEASLAKAMESIRDVHHGSYPVLAADGSLMGALRRDDFYDRIKRDPNALSEPVSSLPLSSLPAADPQASVGHVLDILLRSGKNKVCVTSPEGALLGLATLVDLIPLSLQQPPQAPV